MAQGALFTGATGIRSYQRQLDVVANNLANINTTGFKSDRVLFSDLVYRDYRNGAGSNNAEFGGVNPAQIGTGVQISQISRNFTQGALQDTGEPLDFAIRGEGFFVLQDGNGDNIFTRAGSFSLDNNGNLVDPATGFLVQRTGSVGENSDQQFGFQETGISRINIPFGTAIPGQQTQSVAFNGNLPSSALPPLAEVLSTLNPFETAAGAATTATQLSDLTTNQSDYVAGDVVEILGTNVDGTQFSFTVPGDSATLGDIVDGLNIQLNGATAVLSSSGDLTVTADDTGESFLSVVIRDATGNANLTDFDDNGFAVETEGGSGDIFESATQVFDAQGNAQNVLFTFRKDGFNSWEVTSTLPDNNGNLVNPTTYNLSFNENGTFAIATSGTGTTDLDLQFNATSTAQSIDLDFGSLSHSATDFGLVQLQDGSPPGVLANVNVSGDGLITGVGSNGITIPIAQMALANFSNIDGLEAIGENYYNESSASGVTLIGAAQANGRGTVVGAQLEASNVDITREFAELIIAQRAFSANARTITVADEVLEELTNLVR